MNAIKPSSNSNTFHANIAQLVSIVKNNSVKLLTSLYQLQDFLPNSIVTIEGEFYGRDPVTDEFSEFKQIQALHQFTVVVGNVPFICVKVETTGFIGSEVEMSSLYVPMSSVTAIDSTATTSQKAVIKHISQVKREETKASKGFSPAFFTPGTRCIVQVGRREEAKEIVVKNLVQNGSDSYVIDTGIKHDSEYMKDVTQSYNISHVIQVLEHKPGKLVFGRAYRGRNDLKSISYTELPGLGRANRHIGWDTASMVYNAIRDFNEPGTCIDGEKLIDLLWERGIFKKVSIGQNYESFSVIVANKKKLKRAVRRLLGKVKINARETQEAQDLAYYEEELKAEKKYNNDYND